MSQFSKDKFPWYSGELSDVAIDSDGNVSLKAGKTVGTYKTIVYDSIGTKTSVSWESEESNGEINSSALVTPKTIEMRTSDIQPTDITVSIGPTGLVPYAVTNLFQTDIGWSIAISGIIPAETVMTYSDIKIITGVPYIKIFNETAAMGGGQWIITPGLNIPYQPSDTAIAYSVINLAIGEQHRVSFNETAAMGGGLLIVQGVYFT